MSMPKQTKKVLLKSEHNSQTKVESHILHKAEAAMEFHDKIGLASLIQALSVG